MFLCNFHPLLLIYICSFHVLSHLLLIYICKLHWNPCSLIIFFLSGVAGQLQVFKILYRDIHNNPTTDTRSRVKEDGSLGTSFSEEDIVVVFLDAAGFEVKPPVLAVSLSTDAASVQYIHTKAGEYNMSVKIRGSQVQGRPYSVLTTVTVGTLTPVLGSPYSVFIYPAKADAAKTVCKGLGLRQFNPELSQFNPELSQFNPELSQFNPELSRFNPELSRFNPDFYPRYARALVCGRRQTVLKPASKYTFSTHSAIR